MKKAVIVFLFSSIFFYSCANQLSFSPKAKDHVTEMIRPPYLKTGDTVAVVAASGRVNAKNDSLFIRRLESWGLQVKFGKNVYSNDSPFFAGTDLQRASDLQAMIDDEGVKAIIMYRGGYGAVRTLDYVDFSPLMSKPKWLVGFSDVTMLHYAVNRQGLESIHGAMPSTFRYEPDEEDISAETLRKALFGELKQYEIPPHSLNQKGEATGKLLGGNLSLIYAAAGTDVDLDFSEPTVLFIEDLNEYVYHLDRMMQNLKRSGKLSRIKALVVGYFTDMKNAAAYGMTSEQLISEYTSKYDIPVIFDFPAGHEYPNYALYFGRDVKVTVTENKAILEFLQ